VSADTPGIPQADGRDALAARLQAAWERLAAADLPPQARARLHRQLIALCDAAKAPGASPGACRRRLDGFLEALDNALSDYKSGHKS
jgi:hypothetical protein